MLQLLAVVSTLMDLDAGNQGLPGTRRCRPNTDHVLTMGHDVLRNVFFIDVLRFGSRVSQNFHVRPSRLRALSLICGMPNSALSRI